MPRPQRSEQFDPTDVCIVHVVQRCVRRAFLAGVDQLSGKDYSFRREWIRRRMEALASVFAVDVLSYAIMSNHMHQILRNRPDVVASWSDQEVGGMKGGGMKGATHRLQRGDGPIYSSGAKETRDASPTAFSNRQGIKGATHLDKSADKRCHPPFTERRLFDRFWCKGDS